MNTVYKIHPAIGIARLGNSPSEFCIAPETPKSKPVACDTYGNAILAPDGKSEVPIKKFKDAEGRIKRQAARFQVYVYDDVSPQGRPLEMGDKVHGGGNFGELIDIQWRVYLANKKASWYQFQELQGEHGYAPGHPRRNKDISDSTQRRRLIIDPGPQAVDCTSKRKASFKRKSNPDYAQIFPPPLTPDNIDSLGDIMTDDNGKLLVLGGFGHSGSMKTGFEDPVIRSYANNEGWFDDTSDGPVMARLKFWVDDIKRPRFIDVEAPAWVVAASPAYVPQLLNLITMDDVIYDLGIRQFVMNTEIYGVPPFNEPQQIDSADPEAIARLQTQILRYNPDYYPWFNRDIWPILDRVNHYTWLTQVLYGSNFPHDQSERGTFYKKVLGAQKRKFLFQTSDSGFSSELDKTTIPEGLRNIFVNKKIPLSDSITIKVQIKKKRWKILDEHKQNTYTILKREGGGQLHIYTPLEDKDKEVYKRARMYLYRVLRLPGEENQFRQQNRPNAQTHNVPLMPLLVGDNPINNELPSKFLRLTDTQLFILKQWAEGKFINEEDEWNPASLKAIDGPGRALDKEILSNALGGSFCPGGEFGWIMRNPSIYREPYRLKADPDFYNFGQTPANAYIKPDLKYAYLTDTALSQDSDYKKGLQPGDLTKAIALPWQADFNECSIQPVDVTYEGFNKGYPDNPADPRSKSAKEVWETLWWPAHRPMQVFQVTSVQNGKANYEFVDWAKGIPQTYEGDLKMVKSWWKLGFVISNPYFQGDRSEPHKPWEDPGGNPRFISVEYQSQLLTIHKKGEEHEY